MRKRRAARGLDPLSDLVELPAASRAERDRPTQLPQGDRDRSAETGIARVTEFRPPAAAAGPKRPETAFDAIVFAGGGCRCFWQAGFWSVVAPALQLAPRLVGAVSAGSAFACAALGGVLDDVVEDFKRRSDRNQRNLYPRNLVGPEPVFPHERIYRESIVANIDDAALERIRRGPDIRIFLARPPRWLGARSGFAVGMLAYQLDRSARGRVHPLWARRLGFEGESVSVRSCGNAEELADLILQSSCTPPMTPLYRRDERVVLDGGLVDNVPVETVAGADHALVLLSRHYPSEALPGIPGRTNVQPSRPTPIEKWDYTSPELVQATYDLGRRDGDAFVGEQQRSAGEERRVAS
jgi:predicted acylesterase/phospholipase RssA